MIPNLVAIPDYPYLVLPTGVHKASFKEIEDVYAYNTRRVKLFNGLIKGSIDLADAGCKTLYLDGSYVTSKELPRDFDACWDPDGVIWHDLAQVLQNFAHPRLWQKAKYGGEFFPAIVTEKGYTLDFVEFFQQIVDFKERKGIIKVDLCCDPKLRE